MLRRTLSNLIALTLMVGFGIAVYSYLGAHRTHLRQVASRPEAAAPTFKLPGSIYLAQGGALYRLRDGTFTQLLPAGGWVQPAVSPDGQHLLIVQQGGNWSDLFLADADGHIQKQLTHFGSQVVDQNHWGYYPRFAADGRTIYFSEDSPKDFDYRVDLAIWSFSADGSISQGKQWTNPNFYTGGDASPLPLDKGGLIYSKYDIDGSGKNFSQLFLTDKALAAGRALTPPGDDCSQAAISPDGGQLAMICTVGQVNRLVVASFDGTQLGPLRTLVDGCMCTGPSWAPDGGGLAYLAPAGAAGLFQLWWLPVPAVVPSRSASTSPTATASVKPGRSAAPTPSPSPSGPRQITSGLDFNGVSPPAWTAAH